MLAAWPFHQAQALLNLGGTRNQIFVFGSVTFTHSSNIFYDNTNRGDYSVTREGDQVIVRVKVPIMADGPVRSLTGQGATEALAVKQVVEQIKSTK